MVVMHGHFFLCVKKNDDGDENENTGGYSFKHSQAFLILVLRAAANFVLATSLRFSMPQEMTTS